MTTASVSSCAPAARVWPRPAFFALLLVALLSVPNAAAAEIPSRRQPVPTLVLAVGKPWSGWAPAEWILGNQKRMLQVMTVVVVLGIWLILWRK